MKILLRDATAADQADIADFNSRLATETEGYVLDPERINPGIAAGLADQSKARYWLAEIEGKPVGQIMVTYEWSDWRNGMLWWLQSVYVHEDYRRMGVFSALFRQVESLARKDPGVCGLRLYVEQDNTRAQDVYASLGMRDTSYRVMQILFSETGAESNA